MDATDMSSMLGGHGGGGERGDHIVTAKVIAGLAAHWHARRDAATSQLANVEARRRALLETTARGRDTVRGSL
jgi:hypothetical protein